MPGLVVRLDTEPDRECLDAAALLRHGGDDGTRVDAAGKESAEWDVTAEPEPGRLEKLFSDLLMGFALVDDRAGAVRSFQ